MLYLHIYSFIFPLKSVSCLVDFVCFRVQFRETEATHIAGLDPMNNMLRYTEVHTRNTQRTTNKIDYKTTPSDNLFARNSKTDRRENKKKWKLLKNSYHVR